MIIDKYSKVFKMSMNFAIVVVIFIIKGSI